MKKIIVTGLILAAATSQVNASDITLSKTIKSDLRSKIERDLNLIDSFKFKTQASPRTLQVMGMSALNGQAASEWLNKRVNYVVSENALSVFNLLVKRIIFIDRKDVDFPNANIIPYSSDKFIQNNFVELSSGLNAEGSFTVMSNIGSALYLGGKKERQVYGMKISRGLLRAAEKVAITSPRAGIIQIGEGLFAPELTVNKDNQDALANSIFRLGTFFHEARHSDGNGVSLSFMHTNCPAGHDYAGQPACDENLNGPYTVGTLMMAEMSKACEENCSEKDKETLKVLVLDSASRILTITHKGEVSKDWDATPESL
ncbi:MAG: hypothetical protein H7281_08655 [Bacteriovorax sp.]|nr:hypothetical protein [Bacteriovorax sp.]